MKETARLILSMFIIGLMNNIGYVIINANATKVSSGGVAIVYMSGIVPGMCAKMTAPFWFDRVPDGVRVAMGLLCGLFSFVVVGSSETLTLQLVGICFTSFQSSLGEATMLAVSSQYGASKEALTAWSSGTGFAGVCGYLWSIAFGTWMGLSMRVELYLACVLPAIYGCTYFFLLPRPRKEENQSFIVPDTSHAPATPISTAAGMQGIPQFDSSSPIAVNTVNQFESRPINLTAGERISFALSLWSLIIPLLLVYVFEYALQSGVFPAIGFPVSDKKARDEFYNYSNWTYQAAVVVSRSSGSIWSPGVRTMWIMAFLQVGMYFFFFVDGVTFFWYNYGLIVMCFFVGLLGGGCYVHTFRLLTETSPAEHKELANRVGAISPDAGIALGSLLGLVSQGCLYIANGISGADIPIHSCENL